MCPHTALSSGDQAQMLTMSEPVSHRGSQHSYPLSVSMEGGLGRPHQLPPPSALSLDIPCDTRPDSFDSLCSWSRGFSSSGLLKDLSASNRQAEESQWKRRRLV